LLGFFGFQKAASLGEIPIETRERALFLSFLTEMGRETGDKMAGTPASVACGLSFVLVLNNLLFCRLILIVISAAISDAFRR
jgi:hypothetical protein